MGGKTWFGFVDSLDMIPLHVVFNGLSGGFVGLVLIFFIFFFIIVLGGSELHSRAWFCFVFLFCMVEK